jgi:hypothetical protein
LARWPSWTFDDTLALALAAAGEYASAAEAEQHALALAPAEASPLLAERINEYRRGEFHAFAAIPEAQMPR